MTIDRLKLAIVLLPLVETVLKLRNALAARLALLDGRSVGEVDGVALWNRRILRVESWVVSIASVAAGAAFLIGVVSEFAAHPIAPSQQWLVPVKTVARYFFDRSWWLALLWVVVAVDFQAWLSTSTLLFIARRLDKFATYKPAYVTVHRFRARDDRAVPINISRDACRRISDVLADRLPGVPGSGWLDDAYQRRLQTAITHPTDTSRAVRPADIDSEQRMNILLFANVFESEWGRLRLGAYPYRHLYGLLTCVARERRLFASEALRQASVGSFYDALRRTALELAAEEERRMAAAPDLSGIVAELLPARPAIREALDRFVGELARRYEGHGTRVADGFFGASAAKVSARLAKLPGCEWETTRRQVIKLGRIWSIWPELDPGPLFYPYSRRFTSLFLSVGCLVVPPDQTDVELTPDLERLTTWTEHMIVETTAAIRSRQSAQVEFWLLAAEVDFALWRTDELRAVLAPAGLSWSFNGTLFQRS